MIAKTDAVFGITGRGTIVCLPVEDEWSISKDDAIHKRERIRIVAPTGETIATYIKEIEFINRGPDRGSLAFLLPRHIKPNDVVEGSEIRLARNGSEPDVEP